MNPEIYTILQEIMKQDVELGYKPSDRDAHLSALTARLFVLLAEESETQSNKISEQTDKLVKLTRAIVWFTIVLLGVGVIQIIMMIMKP